MRIIRFFALLISLFAVASCAYNDIDAPSVTPAGNDAVTVCGRITSFGDHYVDTRAGKTNEESYSSSMAMAIFPIEGGALGNCISYVHLQGSNVNFTVDRAKLRETYGIQYDNKPFALYLFANMPELPDNMTELEEKGLNTLASLMQFAYRNTSIRRPQKGFPMVGSLGDNITSGADGNEFILIPTTGEEPNIRLKLPLLNGSPSDYIPIPLKALYAKFSFIITVDPEQHIQNGAAPTFTLENYTLNNVPDSVYAAPLKNTNQTNVIDGNITTSVGTSVTEGGELKFDFYLPERFLTPTTSAEDFPYPLGEGRAEVDGYSNVRDEDKKYCQRFKPDLVTPAQKATYITLNGHYSDHQGHNWKVTYDIYLGEDNYSDFNFRRNMNYINNVVIRGIKAYNHDTNAGPYIDHRVSVEGTLPIIINLQRETLLDSHFEIRPLRVRHPSGAPVGATVTIEILDSLGKSESESDRFPNWVRMEHNNGAGYATSTHLASGKRWYFTFDLVTNTLNIESGKLSKVTLNGTNQETFWIYVDQCDEGAPLNNPNQVRKAKIKVTYDADGDPKTENEELVYTLCQHLLYPVRTIRNGAGEDGSTVIYYIEYEEEYLHNFDSEDTYGNTEYAGIEWGLDGIQLSKTHDAFIISHYEGDRGIGDSFGSFIERQEQAFSTITPQPKYDFYLYRDVKNILGEHFDANNINRVEVGYYQDDEYAGRIKVNDFSGLTFNQEIADFLRTTYESHQEVTSSKDAKIERISLDEEPKSAFAYCYNRNKRKSDGTIYSQDWYLPAIDEIEDIMEFAYGDFDDEFQGNMYWSCQPAFSVVDVKLRRYNRPWIVSWEEMNAWFYGGYYNDDSSHARATQALWVGGEFKDVPSSAANAAYERTGKIYISTTGKKDTTLDPVTYTGVDPYAGHPANMARKGIKARVRCVRKTEGVTVKNN